MKWRPIFKVMMEIIEDKPPSPTVQEVEDMYKAAMEHYLKERISYCFAGKKGKANARWTTGTWSKHVNPGYIRKHGTQEDIARIPEFLMKTDMGTIAGHMRREGQSIAHFSNQRELQEKIIELFLIICILQTYLNFSKILHHIINLYVELFAIMCLP